jgi:chromate transport protein ChrA
MTMHIGYERGGIPGLVVAGSCFIRGGRLRGSC